MMLLSGSKDARIGAAMPAVDSAMHALRLEYFGKNYEGAIHGFARAQDDPKAQRDTVEEQANLSAIKRMRGRGQVAFPQEAPRRLKGWCSLKGLRPVHRQSIVSAVILASSNVVAWRAAPRAAPGLGSLRPEAARTSSALTDRGAELPDLHAGREVRDSAASRAAPAASMAARSPSRCRRRPPRRTPRAPWSECGARRAGRALDQRHAALAQREQRWLHAELRPRAAGQRLAGARGPPPRRARLRARAGSA